jgi:hypothetical protein
MAFCTASCAFTVYFCKFIAFSFMSKESISSSGRDVPPGHLYGLHLVRNEANPAQTARMAGRVPVRGCRVKERKAYQFGDL